MQPSPNSVQPRSPQHVSLDVQTVRLYNTPALAHVAQSVLAQQGIAAFVSDEHLMVTDLMPVVAMDGIKLQVRDEDLAAAIQILDDLDHLVPEDELADDDEG